VQVLIDKQNYPLAAVADYDTTLIDMPVTIDVLANDRKPEGDQFVLSLCGSPAHGIVVLNSDSTITYTPYPGFEGEDSFCYRICDSNKPLLCADTLVYIFVKKPGIEDLHAYNGISPNDDGSNDVWKVRGIEKYPDNTVVILNRWGDKIREFANYNNTTRCWDGKNEKGEYVPDGTYFYIVDVKNVGVLKGWIYLRGK
jgi:gliding motility-associated-like protein